MAAKKKAKKKTASMKSMSQTDAMESSGEKQKYVPSTLDQVWGDDGTSQYKTMDTEVYADSLTVMSKADLKQEAVRVGLLPIDNVEQLRIRLTKQHRTHVSSYKRPQASAQKQIAMSQEVKRILEEGQ